jgi:hypothetical protein
MITRKNNRLLILLSLIVFGVFLTPFITSCGKGGEASSAGLNTQLEVVNLSPDLNAVVLYADYLLQNGTVQYTYPFPSGYFYLNTNTPPLQIRTALVAATNVITLSPTLASNHKYTLFITGFMADSALTPIFTEDDSTSIPNIGFGKVRFVNASLQLGVPVAKTGLDLAVNGVSTPAFSNIQYLGVSAYQQLPAGNYNFLINQTGSTVIISSTFLQNTPIQDGRLYTIYAYGEVVSQADSAAFGAGIITNR